MSGDLLVRWAQLAPSDTRRGDLLTALVESIEARGWTFSTHTAIVTRLADGDTEERIVDRGYGATVFTWSDGKPNSMGPAYSSLEPVATVLLAARREHDRAVKALERAERDAKTQAAVTAEALLAATHARTKYGWNRIVRVNAKTVTLEDLNPYGLDAYRVPHSAILEVREVTGE